MADRIVGLNRHGGESLLSTFKDNKASRDAASSSSSPPTPKPAPMGGAVDRDPDSSSDAEECESAPSPHMSTKRSGYRPRGKPFRPPLRRPAYDKGAAGAVKRSTQDSAVGMSDSSAKAEGSDGLDDPIFEDARSRKRVRTETTYTDKSKAGFGGRHKPGGSNVGNFHAPGPNRKEAVGVAGSTTTPSGLVIPPDIVLPSQVSSNSGSARSSPRSRKSAPRKTLDILPDLELPSKGIKSSSGSGTPKNEKSTARRYLELKILPEFPLLKNSKPSPTGSDDSSEDLSSPPPSPLLDDMDEELNGSGNYDQPALCPICRAPVDAQLLESWMRGRRVMRINMQIAFCEAHKRAAAAEEYAAREYPAISWDALPGRVAALRAELVGVLRRTRPSHFRARLESAAAAGRGRTLAASAKQDSGLHGMTVGYYGPRGRRAMEDWITLNLAGEIRACAGSDRLIGYKTVSGFIQEVLVPELATWLVAQDLDVGEARAREVLAESGDIGELVNTTEEDERGDGCWGAGGGEIVVDDDGEDY